MLNEKSFPAESSSHNFVVSFWVTLIVKQLSKNFNISPKRNKQRKSFPPLYNNGENSQLLTIAELERGKFC